MSDIRQAERLAQRLLPVLAALPQMGAFLNPHDYWQIIIVNQTSGQVYLVTVEEGQFVIADPATEPPS